MLSKSLGVVHIIDMISISDACLVVTNPQNGWKGQFYSPRVLDVELANQSFGGSSTQP